MENNIKLEVSGDTLIIREGQALPLHDPEKISIKGTIDAPSRFLEAKKDSLVAIETTLYVNQNDGTLKLVSDEKSFYKTIVEGVLKKSKAISDIGINNDQKFYSDKGLAKFVRQNIFLFADREKANDLVKKLMTFSAKIETSINKDADLKGNFKAAVERMVTTHLPETIDVNCRVFEGLPKQEFTVNIGIEPSATEVKLYFDSPQLYELEEQIKDAVLNEEITKFKEFGCAVIYI